MLAKSHLPGIVIFAAMKTFDDAKALLRDCEYLGNRQKIVVAD
jgi:hypothetical protein